MPLRRQYMLFCAYLTLLPLISEGAHNLFFRSVSPVRIFLFASIAGGVFFILATKVRESWLSKALLERGYSRLDGDLSGLDACFTRLGFIPKRDELAVVPGVDTENGLALTQVLQEIARRTE